MNGIGKRLRFIREKTLNLSRKKFVKDLGVSADTLENYENEETSPDAAFLTSLFSKYSAANIDVDWLLFGKAKERPPSDDLARVPLYDVRASGGGGAFVAGEEVVDMLAFKKDWLTTELKVSEKDLSLLFVDGESMEPTLRPGDMVMIVNQNDRKISDGIYVVRLEDTLLVKRLQRLPGHKIKVTSDHPAYEPFIVDLKKPGKDFVVIGRVVWAGRRF